jgi:hypothetical protein
MLDFEKTLRSASERTTTMATPDRTYQDPEARKSRLLELGLTDELVREVVEYGLGARSACTALHPPSYPGYSQWAETHYAARLRLVPRGWTADDSRNFSRTVSPDGRMAFTVSTGDENTGKPGLPQPCTKHPRGSETGLAIEMNKQLSLFDAPVDSAADLSAVRPERETWTLLIATTPDEVRYELSLGDDQDAKGRITSWSERLLFPALEIDQSMIPDQGDVDDDDGLGDIDVPVTRR